jgi:hypothetical protein
VAVGGWMQFFFSAALIRSSGCTMPTSIGCGRFGSTGIEPHELPTTKWPSSVSFDFRDAAGQAVKMTSGQVVDTTAPRWDIPTTTRATSALPRRSPHDAEGGPMPKTTPPEMMRTAAPFMLDQMVTQASFAVKTRPRRDQVHDEGRRVAPPRCGVFLNIEQVVSKEAAPLRRLPEYS